MEMRSRSFGDNLNLWFRSLGHEWKGLVIIALLTHVPAGILVALLFWLTGASQSWVILLDPERAEGLTNREVLDLMIPFAWGILGWVVIQVVAAVFVYLVSARIVALDLAQEDEPLRDTMRRELGRLGTGIASALIVVLAGLTLIGLVGLASWVLIDRFSVEFFTVFLIMVMALTSFVLLTWLGVSVGFSQQVIALEGSGPVDALTRSFRLVQGRWWVSLGFILVTSLIASAVSQVVGLVLIPFFLLGVLDPRLFAIGYGMTAVLQGPLVGAIGAAYAIWYVDLRARREPVTAEQLLA